MLVRVMHSLEANGSPDTAITITVPMLVSNNVNETTYRDESLSATETRRIHRQIPDRSIMPRYLIRDYNLVLSFIAHRWVRFRLVSANLTR